MARVKWLPPTPYPTPGSLPEHVGGMIWLVSGPLERAWRTRPAWLVSLPAGGGIQCVLQAVEQSALLVCIGAHTVCESSLSRAGLCAGEDQQQFTLPVITTVYG
jgi:hypothetical protein